MFLHLLMARNLYKTQVFRSKFWLDLYRAVIHDVYPPAELNSPDLGNYSPNKKKSCYVYNIGEFDWDKRYPPKTRWSLAAAGARHVPGAISLPSRHAADRGCAIALAIAFLGRLIDSLP
eukprot:bmy_01683T0